MRDKKKFAKIAVGSALIGIPVLAGIVIGIVSLTRARKEDKQNVESVAITNHFDPISIGIGVKYTSDPIEVKCFDNSQNEVKGEVSLGLFDENENSTQYSWISINSNNQIVIDGTGDQGNYVFYLIAAAKGNNLIYDFRRIKLSVKDPYVPPPVAVVEHVENYQFYSNSIEIFEDKLKPIIV